LGRVDFRISCSGQSQAEFNRATALLHHMTYPEARAVFERVAASEPRCAMAHWGIAMTLFQPLWPTRPGPAELRRGWAAARRAQALEPATARERLFIAAAVAFFEDPVTASYAQRLEHWEDAMKRVHEAFPQDAEATAFYALAHLATAPADRNSVAHADRAAQLLLQVYERHPDHPGAMHYLIHANDVPGRERQFLQVVRKYQTIAPENPHALHMPTHIYTRLGAWPDVIEGNLRAADAALAQRAGEHGEYVWDEFPHAIEYLIYAYLQQGADGRAAAQLQRLRRTSALEPTFKTAFHLASTEARYVLERRQWRAARALQPRTPASLHWERFPWAEAVTWFARGLGAAHTEQLDDTQAALAHLRRLEADADLSGEILFTRQIRVLRLATGAWLAQAEGRSSFALEQMQEAVELEGSTPKPAVTPAPTLPAQELLGDLLLAQGRAADALAAYERSMDIYPKRFNSLLGAARAARSAQDSVRARELYTALLDVAAPEGTREPALAEARAFLRE